MEEKHCEICRAPQAMMPCNRCVFPPPHRVNRTTSLERQSRPSKPLLLENKYQLLEELGRGAMGTVFKAVDQDLDREVAVKFLLPEIQRVPEMVERFRKEAKAMAAVNHENVARIYSRGRFGEADFLIMELIEGSTLENTVEAAYQRRSMLSLPKVLSVLDQTAAGLAAIHEAGVIHRDVKPGNVMVVNDTDRVVIMDFGIGHKPMRSKKMQTVLPGGTPGYMAPEIIEGGQIETAKEYLSDIYALGVTAFEALTGVLPFDGENWVEVLQNHLVTPPPKPSSLRPEIPEYLDEIVLRCLEKKREDRFVSATDFRVALHPLLVDYGVIDGPSGQYDVTFIEGNVSENACTEAVIVVANQDPGARDLIWNEIRKRRASCRVLSARSNTEGLALMDEHQYAIFIGALEDDRLNGIELAGEILAHMGDREIDLYITAMEFTAGERRLLDRLGVKKLLELPLAPDHLGLFLDSIM